MHTSTAPQSRREQVEAIYDLIKDLDEAELRELAAEIDRRLFTRRVVSEFTCQAVRKQEQDVGRWVREAVRDYASGGRHVAGR